MVFDAGTYPESLPGSHSIPRVGVAAAPIAHRTLFAVKLSDSRMNPTEFAGGTTFCAVVVADTNTVKPLVFAA